MPKLHDIDVDAYLLQCVEISDMDLEGNMVRHSAELAYWNHKLAQALRAHLFAKIEVKRTRARLLILVRQQLDLEVAEYLGDVKHKPRAPTESMVEARVDTHPEMIEGENAAIEAEVERRRIEGVVEAIKDRGDMLRSLGARLRAEMERDPAVRDKMATERFFNNNNHR